MGVRAGARLVLDVTSGGTGRSRRMVPLFVLVASLALVVFLAAPWPLSLKARALLHGLCAQRPSHSFSLGGTLLPFDARMTGIYGGFAMTALWLVLRGRLRAWTLPARSIVGVLALFVAALAIDGTNALLVDIGIDPLYQPDNRLRLATGLLTGVSLAVGVCVVLASTLWRHGDPTLSPVRSFAELGLLVALQIPIWLAVTSGLGLLYAPMAVALVAAAVVVVSSLVLACLTMVRLRDRTYRSWAELNGAGAVSLILALGVMGAFAGARFWAEQSLPIQPLP